MAVLKVGELTDNTLSATSLKKDTIDQFFSINLYMFFCVDHPLRTEY